ncbi:hypothetical protein [Maribacter aquivivus]|uniref:hypothetical protein n=1 Tax=Maribacter aquivivus TaxID=228958 RepID=UPI00249208D7|nr:hypothetical protein [Maribacter aquivivus]
MTTKTGFLIIYILFLTNRLTGQSFIVKTDGVVVDCSKVIVKKNTVILKNENSEEFLKISKDSIREFYQDQENSFYKNKNGLFLEEIIIGYIQVFKGETIEPNIGPSIGNMSGRFTKWYMEKDGFLFEAFTEVNGSSRVVDLKNGNIKGLIDETESKKAFNELDKKFKLEDLLGIIQSYNAKNASLKERFLEINKNANDSKKVILLRDFGGEIKNSLEFTINNKKYSLEKNSKLEVLIPSNYESIICISNSINNACGVITSSPNYSNYYRLKLNKKNLGTITKINGNSSYYKARLDYYEKRAKK